MFGHTALKLLVGLKIRAGVRQQVRRLKRPSGWIFMILGLGLVLLWAGSFAFGNSMGRIQRMSPAEMELATGLGLVLLAVMTVVGAFSHRGLYLPKEEIERCFSGPISRSDLVRYRLLTNLLRSLFAGVLFGVLSARRMPVAAFGFTGVMVAMLTLPILGQAAALLLGDAENRVAKIAARLPLKIVSIVLAMVLVASMGYLMVGDGRPGHLSTVLRSWMPAGVSNEGFADHVRALPLVRALLVPCKPWLAVITATEAATFVPWLGVCLAIWVVSFELTVRIPVDFRELSLATSADVAKRLNRIRRGGFGASGANVSKATLGWRVPWMFGRGSFGAIAWLKLASIVRKARGTLGVSAAIVALVTVLLSAAFDGNDAGDIIAGAGALAAIGTFYLCAGLRFDFRNDLELMEQIKAWPVRPTLVFLATILPEVALVSGVLYAGILGRAAFTSAFHPAVLGVLALQPLVTLAWVALDNAVFLYSPVRYSPGQEGALQHMGRSLVLMLLRVLLLAVTLFVAGGPAALTYYVVENMTEDTELALWAAGAVAWCFLVAVDLGLVLLGGRMLRRFDLARDRG